MRRRRARDLGDAYRLLQTEHAAGRLSDVNYHKLLESLLITAGVVAAGLRAPREDT
jgi:hypothetical protein